MKPHRKSFIVILSFALSLFGILEVDASAKRPNILLVVADDMGWTDLGCFGSEIETPNLDLLAKRGMVFTDFHVSVSCSPTRSMLLSGTDNHIAGLGNMIELMPEKQIGKPGYEGHLNDRVVSLADVLRGGGYHTYLSGKWHLGHGPGLMPFNRGFERTYSMLVGGASHWSDMRGILPRDDPAKYSKNGKHLKSLPADFYSSKSYADFMMESIRENRGDGKPFLAYLAFTAVHDPVQVPEPWLSKYKGKYKQGYEVLKKNRWEAARKIGLVPNNSVLPERHPLIKPWNELTQEKQDIEARGMEVYAGMLEAMDYNYGRVINFLKDIDEYDNTVIIFLSDNGSNPAYSEDYPGVKETNLLETFDNSLENIGNPGSNYAYGIGFGSGSSGPLDKFKLTVGEGGIRSPLIISGPGVTSGKRNKSFAYVTDLMPTILELAGVEHPAKFNGRKVEPMRGRSMVGLFDGSKQKIYNSDEFVGGEMAGGKWMRQGDLKAVMIPPPFGSGKWELYDVASDPGESIDLSIAMPDKMESLKAAWDRYAKEVGVISLD